MSQTARRPRALCILGMHRSGTSAITRAFNLLGAYLGAEHDLLPAQPDNPEGFWERTDIMRCHDRLLRALRRRWDTALPLPDGWHRAAEVAPFHEELRAIVQGAFAGRPFWAWKDPRTCLLLELWKEILAECETDLLAVLVVRHPRDVAQSLARRNGFGLEKSYGIWLNYNLAAVSSAEGIPTACVAYDDFIENPAGELRRCADALDLAWPQNDSGFTAGLGAFVRPDLRHSVSEAEAITATPTPVRRFAEIVTQNLATSPVRDGAFFDNVRECLREYCEQAAFYREDLEQYIDTLDELAAAEARCVEGEARARAAAERAQAQLDATEARARAAAEQAQAQLDATEARARAAAEQAQAQLQKASVLAQDLERRRSETAQALQTVLDSKLWRMTAPLRKMLDVLLRRSS